MFPKSSLIKTLSERGFIYQTTHEKELDQKAHQEVLTAYVGFDATSNSLQVGNLLMLMFARWIQKCGHKVILLIGGGTTKIGDPSGKTESRQMLSDEKIEENIQGLKKDFERILSFQDEEGLYAPVLVNNADWLDELKYIPFLREVGVHFSVNRMIAFDHVKSRLDAQQNLSFIEFNYSLMQSYDFLELFKRYGCTLQFGGSDQWGNIVSGVDLVRRMTGQDVFGLTCPLLTMACGSKMGKSAQGAIWLNPEKTSPYDYWQFWRNVDDKDVLRFLKLYTFLPIEEIEALSALKGQEMNKAKIILADQATGLLHGFDQLEPIHQAVEALFRNKNATNVQLQIYHIDKAELENLKISLPFILKQIGFTASLTQARQKINEGAVKINDLVIQDIHKILNPGDFVEGRAKISLGSKKHAYLQILDA